jgi:hypothetical protein
MISATPIDMDMIVAVVGLCFGTRDRTQMVSTVVGTDPAANNPATRQSTLPFLEWIAGAKLVQFKENIALVLKFTTSSHPSCRNRDLRIRKLSTSSKPDSGCRVVCAHPARESRQAT